MENATPTARTPLASSSLLVVIGLTLLVPGRAYPVNLFAGIFNAGTDGHAAWITSDWNGFTAKWAELEKVGLRMVDFETYLEGSARVYVGIFREGTGGHAAWFTDSWTDFTAKWAEFERGSLRMEDFETYVEGGKRIYAGIFREGTGGHAAWFTDSWSDFTAKWAEFERGSLRMKDFETYVEGGKRIYAGIFREGTGGHAAWFTADWNEFTAKWDEFNQAGLRMVDFETYEDGGQRIWGGIWRAGTYGSAAWIGVDYENFSAKWHDLEKAGLRLVDIEIYSGGCASSCSNQVVMPASACPDTPPEECVYNYGVQSTSTHCEGLPGSCGNPGASARVWYRQPIDMEGDQRYARLSALDIPDQIFTLPFTETDLTHNGWLYSPGSWHHAIDYGRGGDKTFRVRAAAPGRVIHIGWDDWSGGTVVVSHDAGGETDRYRTIYMHLRNGAQNDCQKAWTQTVPYLESFTDQPELAANYKAYLEATGCHQNGPDNPDPLRWGGDSDTIDMGLLGKQVDAGDVLGWAGSTGPGGCGCTSGGLGPNTHLHVFFAHQDPQNGLWYFFDPYGIYGTPDCYPAGITDAIDTPCARYPVAWKGGRPQYPTPRLKLSFHRGDSSGDGDVDVTDAIVTLGCLFLGQRCPGCAEAADIDDSGELDITDAIATLSCLFLGDCPRAYRRGCEADPTPDGLGCRESPACR